MLLPFFAVDSSDAAVVKRTQLGLAAVASDLESLQVDEQFLSDGQKCELVGGIDTDDNAARLVLYGDLLVDVSAGIISVHCDLQLYVVSNLFLAVGVNDALVLRLQLGNRDDLRSGIFLYLIVSVGGIVLNALGHLPFPVHAGTQCEAACGYE